MGQRDRDFIEKMDQHMEQISRLHGEVLRAADRVEEGAERTEKAVDKLETWTLSIQKRVERLEIRQAYIAGGAFVAGVALWEKMRKILGLI